MRKAGGQKSPAEAQHEVLQGLIREGRVRAVMEWVATGKPVRQTDPRRPSTIALWVPAKLGGYDLMEILLGAAPWSQEELGPVLKNAVRKGQTTMVRLLLAAGAPIEYAKWSDVCDRLDYELTELCLRAGMRITGDEFATRLAQVIRPAFGMLARFRKDFPILEEQASMALLMALEHQSVGSFTRLVAAKADPWREVGQPPTKVAEDAMINPDPAYLMAMKWELTANQANRLLELAMSHPFPDHIRTVIESAPKLALNTGPQGECPWIQRLLKRFPETPRYSTEEEVERNADPIACVRVLIDHGAHWHPTLSEKWEVRIKCLLRHGDQRIDELAVHLMASSSPIDVSEGKSLREYLRQRRADIRAEKKREKQKALERDIAAAKLIPRPAPPAPKAETEPKNDPPQNNDPGHSSGGSGDSGTST